MKKKNTKTKKKTRAAKNSFIVARDKPMVAEKTVKTLHKK